MKYFDLHCDTITECLKNKKGLQNNDMHIDLSKTKTLDSYVQCFAVFVSDSMPRSQAFSFFERCAKKLLTECEEKAENLVLLKNQGDFSKSKACKNKAILTVENGAAISGDLKNLEKMAELGVKMMTLTWNGDNEIGTGAATSSKIGLTDFGRSALKSMENLGIVADISHASDRLFFDVAEYAEKPFVASHSNSKEICPHRRNLTNEQFEIIKAKKGLVGLNFYKAFLNKDEDKAERMDIIRHAEHFLSLGGEDVLAMGSDFDGADMPKGISGIESVEEIYNDFLKINYNEDLVKKIFYDNAKTFYLSNKLL